MINSTKTTLDRITFDSKLESKMYLLLKSENLFDKYNAETFTLLEPFKPSRRIYQRFLKGKGVFKLRNNVVPGITYTPDFTSHDYIIEVKGFPNEKFSMRWRLFLNHLEDTGDQRIVYKPHTVADMIETIRNIKAFR